jgi:alkylation response protein AidB-like acyl-CoA dehydrogenase
MDFTFTEDQAMIAETARSFFAEHATSERVRQAMASEGIDEQLWRGFAGGLGFGGATIPEALGGAGLGGVELAILAEAAGYHVAALPLLATMGLAVPALVHGGTQDQQRAWLPLIAAGNAIGTVAFTSDLTFAAGTASGAMERVSHGMAADFLIAFQGGAAMLVDLRGPGVERRHWVTMDQTRPFARVTLIDAPCAPLANPAAAQRAAFATGCLAIAADALGGAQACLDRTVAWSMERVQFGRAIGSFQAVKHRLADMLIEIEQSRSAVYWAACALDGQTGDAEIALHSAKSMSADTYAACAGAMIQLHGGVGFTWEHDAHLYFKRAQANRTMLETPEWHRERLAAIVMEETA